MAIGKKDLDIRFSPQSVSSETQQSIDELNKLTRTLAGKLDKLLPDGQQKSLALTLLEDVRFRSGAALAQGEALGDQSAPVAVECPSAAKATPPVAVAVKAPTKAAKKAVKPAVVEDVPVVLTYAEEVAAFGPGLEFGADGEPQVDKRSKLYRAYKAEGRPNLSGQASSPTTNVTSIATKRRAPRRPSGS